MLLIDNSLSMGYQELDKTLLDGAKVQAKDLIDGLARGSRISVVPTCSPESQFSYSAYYNKDDAKEALDTIRPVDRSTAADAAVNRAMKALPAGRQSAGQAGRALHRPAGGRLAGRVARRRSETSSLARCS